MLPADIVVFDQLDQILVLVEVKAVQGSSVGWARDIREGVLNAQPGLATPPYFLVVARDWLYLWTSRVRDLAPDQQYSTSEVLAPYFRDSQTNAETIPRSALELMVGIWLGDLASGWPRELVSWLAPSGLAEAVALGRVEFLSAA
jgi:hypothetical protein